MPGKEIFEIFRKGTESKIIRNIYMVKQSTTWTE